MSGKAHDPSIAEPERRNRPMNKPLKPGMITPQSGIYSPSKGGFEVAIAKGNRVPPTKPGGTFTLKTPTKKT
jgi:hypothetical protein